MKLKLVTPVVAIIASLSLFVLSCKKKTDDPKTDDNPKWTTTIAPTELVDVFKKYASDFVSKTIDGAAGGSISKDSITVMFAPNSFAKLDGTNYTGSVNLKLKTVKKVSDMFFSRITTINKNDILLSSGMFVVEAYSNTNEQLKMRNGVKYVADFENVNYLPTMKTFKATITTDPGNTVQWDTWSNANTGRRVIGGGTSITGLDSLFKYTNLDRFMNETPLTDITIKCPAGYTNTNTEVMLKYPSETTSAYVPANTTLQAFSTSGTHYKVVQGRSVKIIAVCKKNGKFYTAQINISAITSNHTETISTMTEVTEAQMKAQIDAF